MVTHLLLILALGLVLAASPGESYSPSPRSLFGAPTAKVSTTQLNKWRKTKATWKSGPGQTSTAPSTLPHLVGVAPPEPQAAPAAEASAFETSAALQYGGMPAANGAVKPGGYGFGSGSAKWKTGGAATPAATAFASFSGVQPTQAKAAYAKGKYGFGAGAAKWKSGASTGSSPGGFTPAAAAPAAVAPAAPAAAAPSKGWGFGAGAAKWKS